MSIIGSSIITSLASASSITGPTGPTGITGPRGLTGFGLTGATGNSVVGITLIDRFIVTTFFDGSTYGTIGQAIGATGSGAYTIKMSNVGNGISLGYSLSGNTLSIRPIRFVETEAASFVIKNKLTGTTSYDVSLIPELAGITLISGSSVGNLLTFNSSKKLTTIPNTFGSTLGVSFVSANVFEYVRGGGWTGSTGAINCIGSATGITCTINPTVKEYDKYMYGSASHVYVTNFRGSTASIVLVDPPNDQNVYGFDLILNNAKNPLTLANRFSSNVKWSLNRTPCFSFAGTTCDMKISFFGLGGTTSWYATAISTSSRCSGVSLFDSDCSGNAGFMAGSSVNKTGTDIGACCTADGSCEETYASNCLGFFHGSGTTCGSVYNSICNRVGSCCVFSEMYSCYDYLTCTECLSLGVGDRITTQFGGANSQCSNTDCDALNAIYFNFS